jgi:hypothetical protein
MKKYLFLLTALLFLLSSFQHKKKKKAVRQPACVQQLISQMKAEPVQNPPASIYSYTWHKTTVYYVPAKCCDFFSDLYDSTCKIIAHPDGGITGKGDGKAPDFFDTRTNEKLLWKDTRKQ